MRVNTKAPCREHLADAKVVTRQHRPVTRFGFNIQPVFPGGAMRPGGLRHQAL